METWREIDSFPGYSVSDTGFVRNDSSGRLMARLVNQSGILNVGLVRDSIQYKRSLALLVANAFLPKPSDPKFDTPINLNGDRSDNCVPNLAWRPRWFARKYFRQFGQDPDGLQVPIEEIKTGRRFLNSWEAAITFGLLDHEIKLAVMNNGYVWPTYQTFRCV